MPLTDTTISPTHLSHRLPVGAILGSLGLIILVWVSRHNFLLFHSIAELFSISVAWALFILVWNTRKVIDDDALVFIGMAYFFVGLIDMLHTLSYKGMGVFQPQWGANLPTQLWILARYMECLAFAAFPFLIKKPIPILWTFLPLALVTTLCLYAIFGWKVFPDCYVEGMGLTGFKKNSEYILCLILGVAGLGLYRKKNRLDRRVFKWMLVSVVTTAYAELAFTFYVEVYDISNAVGHFFKIISFYCLALALVRSGLTNPYTLLFRSLSESEAKYQNMFKKARVGLFRSRLCDGGLLEVNDLCASLSGYDSPAACLADAGGEGRSSLEHLAVELGAQAGINAVVHSDDHPLKRKDGATRWISAAGYLDRPRGVFECALVDMSDRKEQEILHNILIGLIDATADNTMDDLLRHFLDEIERLTESRMGFFHFIDEEKGTISLQAWSTKTVESLCDVKKEGLHYPVSRAGVWADCLRDRKPVIHNDYGALPHKKGLPHGHVPVIRELTVPLFRSGAIVAIIGVGNKETPYTEKDVAILQTLADSAWEIVVRKKAEETLRQAHDTLEQEVKKRTRELMDEISERKRYEIDLKKTMHELEESNADMSQFLYVASHDLQEPLRAIVGFLQLLKAKYTPRLDEKGAEYIDRTINASHRMQHLISDLLILSRIKSSQDPMEPTDINHILTRTLEQLRDMITGKDATITHDTLPVLTVDKNQIQTLFLNLISNALKYNNDDKPVVHIGWEKTPGGHRFYVKDNGIGIHPKFYERIFLVFQRLHGRNEYSGTGIGLTLCRKIIERHGGEIWVASAEETGSTFYFTLPEERGENG